MVVGLKTSWRTSRSFRSSATQSSTITLPTTSSNLRSRGHRGRSSSSMERQTQSPSRTSRSTSRHSLVLHRGVQQSNRCIGSTWTPMLRDCALLQRDICDLTLILCREIGWVSRIMVQLWLKPYERNVLVTLISWRARTNIVWLPK